MDYETVRVGLAQAIPYNGHLGLELVDVKDGSGSVRLPDQEHLKNHVGSQHAGGLFSAGEFASGAAFIGAFVDKLGSITPLAKAAGIEYLKLAHGAVTATATLSEDKSTLLERLDSDGRVEFPIDVELVDEDGNTVARMSVDWHVRQNS
jgi:acyl-coenzyme A thioesterase PaaI-like protein